MFLVFGAVLRPRKIQSQETVQNFSDYLSGLFCGGLGLAELTLLSRTKGFSRVQGKQHSSHKAEIPLHSLTNPRASESETLKKSNHLILFDRISGPEKSNYFFALARRIIA